MVTLPLCFRSPFYQTYFYISFSILQGYQTIVFLIEKWTCPTGSFLRRCSPWLQISQQNRSCHLNKIQQGKGNRRGRAGCGRRQSFNAVERWEVVHFKTIVAHEVHRGQVVAQDYRSARRWCHRQRGSHTVLSYVLLRGLVLHRWTHLLDINSC